MTTYRTKMFDRMDKICDGYYGTANEGYVEYVYEANPDLVWDEILLPAGLAINMPPSKNKPSSIPDKSTIKIL